MISTVSVIIPCFNVEQWVQTQIDAVLPQLGGGDELLLVDNRSTDTTAAILARAAAQDARVRVVPAMERAGANHARNTGMLAARGRVILFCDADDVVSPGWVDAFRNALAQGGLAGGRATPVDAKGERVGDDLGLHVIFGGPAYPLGASMGLTREVLEAVGGFDEAFVGGHEETDLAWRAAAAGWETQFVPGAHVSYLQRSNAPAVLRQRRNYARTAIQLWLRHQDTVDPYGVSLKGAAMRFTHSIPTWARVRLHGSDTRTAAEAGWDIGLLEGHLRYRVVGRPPAPRIPAFTP